MKHVIIGGNGFLGHHLAGELQKRGETVLIADLPQSGANSGPGEAFVPIDVSERRTLDAVPIDPDDVVYHLAARLLIPIVSRKRRKRCFWDVNYIGTKNVLDYLFSKGCQNLIYFTTDMVYGHTRTTPRTEDHPRVPIGPYGESKLASEDLCFTFREKGMRISIFRPRMIIGPGRLGLLKNLFRLVDSNLPVPLIGNGTNYYQFISVFDCVSAAVLAVGKGIPNSEYNLGSLQPLTVRDLLQTLIREAGSRSFLLPTPWWLTQSALALLDLVGAPLMDPEQYLIANETCILDVSRADRELGWRPRYGDSEMLLAAYDEYRNRSGIMG